MRMAVIDGTAVVNLIEVKEGGDFALEGLDLIPSEEAGQGWTYTNGIFAPPPVPAAEEITASRPPELYAAAQLTIQDGDVQGLALNSRFAGAFWAGTGCCLVLFIEALPDADYLVSADAGACRAYVEPTNRWPEGFQITIADQAGAPIDPPALGFTIVRAP